MKVRLGYACNNVTLNNLTTSSTYTYTEFNKKKDYQKLDNVIDSNLQNLNRIIDYNIKNNIHFYRLSSKLIPLATKEDVSFDYLKRYENLYHMIGKKIKENNMRVDFHLDQYAVLNSTKKEVVDNTIKLLDYHYNLLDKFMIKDKVLIIHVGSNVLGKENSITRFINNFNRLDDKIKKSIVIENDDKIFTISDCVNISKQINVRVVLDYHHYLCNGNNDLDKYIIDIFNMWDIPKIHFSSPKDNSKKNFRSHSDYIDCFKFIEFINIMKKYDRDIDIMLEVKNKDDALFRLVRQLKFYTDYNFLDDSTFVV